MNGGGRNCKGRWACHIDEGELKLSPIDDGLGHIIGRAEIYLSLVRVAAPRGRAKARPYR
jgi:hypothetical protein